MDQARRDLLMGMGGIAALSLAGPGRADTGSTVFTHKGPVRGYVDQGISVFKGIRYGATTAGRRFQAPEEPVAWAETVDAFDYAPASPQRGSGGATSEDCLCLNVWTPGAGDGQRRPVMVYIHGGAYATGSGSDPLYDGVRLCRRGDVVVVTINHRLNLFGYAYLARLVPGLKDSGNAGQLDLILALRWIQRNIAVFGGDPERVMVFGQSGGGAKIATLMAMPAARGLFHRAATMSGQQVTASGPAHATQRSLAWLEKLGLAPTEAGKVADLPTDVLLEAARIEDPILGFGGLYFGPVLDEQNLSRHPFYPDAPGQSAQIPMIIGNTHDETRAFIATPQNLAVTWETLESRLTLANMRVDIDPATVVATYRQLYPHYSPSDVLFSATTAARSWRGAIIEAEARARSGSEAWVYQLDWASPRDGGRLGAPHMSDIQLVFDNIGKPGATAIGPEAKPMADMMSEAFIAFARTGDPNSPGLPHWEPYGLARRQTLVFDIPPRLVDDPRGAERRFFEKVPYVQPGT